MTLPKYGPTNPSAAGATLGATIKDTFQFPIYYQYITRTIR
jgi:hypothetical protein